MLPIAPRSGGRLAEMRVAEGRQVKAGEVLARLDDADLAHTVEELTARANYARAQFERTRSLVAKNFLSAAELDRTRSSADDRATAKVMLVFRNTRPATRIPLSGWGVSGDGPGQIADKINDWLRNNMPS